MATEEYWADSPIDRRQTPLGRWFPTLDAMIASNDPLHRSVRPMLPANSVSPAKRRPGSTSTDFAVAAARASGISAGI